MSRIVDNFAHAIAIVYTSVAYDWDKLKTIQEISGIFDPFAYGTPDETRATGKGLCREKAILACDETWQRGVSDVRLVIGTIDADGCKHCDGAGHAWCEVHDGDAVVKWGDPTNTTAVVDPAAWETGPLRYAPTDAYPYNGKGFSAPFPYTREA